MTTTHDAPASAITPIPAPANAPEGYELRAVDRATLVDNPQTPCDRGRISRGPLLGPPRLASPDLGSRVVPQVPRRLRLRTFRARSRAGG